ncbi:hypothetical protein CDAR_109051 [Caerostris darwini]|uniref:Uncharacterized protein n=1 Tax=Caerostris darwini TaxID=1538125 RepID=A0AAV4VDI0_9ARAC|nr:hypothetical protein CDAR_109051 [Caerostris darwini]
MPQLPDTSTALVWLRMRSAHYVGSPIWMAFTCGTVLSLSMGLMALLHTTTRLGVVWLSRYRLAILPSLSKHDLQDLTSSANPRLSSGAFQEDILDTLFLVLLHPIPQFKSTRFKLLSIRFSSILHLESFLNPKIVLSVKLRYVYISEKTVECLGKFLKGWDGGSWKSRTNLGVCSEFGFG